MVGHLSVADSQIVYYKQQRGGQMECGWLDDSRRSVPVLQTETSVKTTPHEHYEYELGNATRVPENPGNPPVF